MNSSGIYLRTLQEATQRESISVVLVVEIWLYATSKRYNILSFIIVTMPSL